MIASRFRLKRFLALLLAGVLSASLIEPAEAWDSTTDSLLVCNTNKNHDVVVAVATQAIPWGIAALMATGWRRQGWWNIPAGKCEYTVHLQDVKYYEIWLHVEVTGGDQIEWPTRKEKFCVHPANAFEAYVWSKEELQKCGNGERLETFSYMTNIDNLEDQFSIYRMSNITVDLDFTYQKSTHSPAQPETALKDGETSPRHRGTGKLVGEKTWPSNTVSMTLKLWKLTSPAADDAVIERYTSRLDQPSDYEILTCTYDSEVVNGQLRRMELSFWHNSVHPDYLELIRQLSTRESLARIYGIRAVSACPASLDEATGLIEQNAREAANLR